MRNSKINFADLIISAQKGSNEAMTQLLEMYMKLINKHCFIDGQFDEDLRQEIILKVITNIKSFKI